MAVDMVAKVTAISPHGDIALQGTPRPGAPTPERQLSLAYINIPRMNRSGDETGAFQAREMLRKALVGKQVSFNVAYTIPQTKREFGVLKVNGQDVAEILLREGWAKLREENAKREDTDKSVLEKYQTSETAAKDGSHGLWATDSPAIEVNYENPTDARSFLERYQGKQLEAIIEQVRAGDLLRARLLLSPTQHQYVNVLVGGIRCPSSTKTSADGPGEAGEEFGDEAKTFVETRLHQRSVHINLLGLNQSASGYVATVSHPAGNIAEALLSSGLARVADHQITTIGSASAAKLRSLETAAKARKLKLWKSHVTKATTATGSIEGVVSRVLSADTLFVRTKEGQEKRLQLSSIRGPRSNDAKQAPFIGEAKEFLRKKAIGKHITVSHVIKKPASEGFDEREVATITLGKDNIAKLLVERGHATVIRHRRDDEDRSPIWDELIAAEETAVKEQKGMHSAKIPAAPGRIVEASENATRAKQYLSTLQRAKRVNAVVDFVASGGRFKLTVPRENAKLTFVLSGIRVPRTARNASETSEPFGSEAADYASKKCLQRDVEVEVETVDKVGGFIGSMYVNRENFAVGLLEEGFASVHEYSAEQSGHGTLYREAESRAKQARKGMWLKYDPAAEEAAITDTAQASASPGVIGKKEYIDVVVSDANTLTGSFSVQIVGDSVRQLEKLMAELQTTCKSGAGTATAPKVGDQVAALFSEDDMWYRGRVKRVDRATSKADVLYYDYGNSEAVSFKKLQPLPPKAATLPAQSKEAKLSFLAMPQNAEYLEDSVHFLQSLCQKQLVACVDKRETVLNLTLYDPEESDPTESINSKLVEEGWATVIPLKKMTWEKAYGSTIKALQAKQATAQKRHKGMFEFGDSTAYEE